MRKMERERERERERNFALSGLFLFQETLDAP